MLAQQPMVVPVIINQQSQNHQSGFGGQREGGLNNVSSNDLRDMIQQAVSTQLTLHNLKNTDPKRQSVATNKSYDSNRTTQTMRDEEAKIRCE
mmetsp:Transcript_41219/g.62722  ORF Transcript_41219/g.62722 Transcript_41219/m.62722 type:complete len:93 (+) Transcript_41219:875-1153(+)